MSEPRNDVSNNSKVNSSASSAAEQPGAAAKADAAERAGAAGERAVEAGAQVVTAPSAPEPASKAVAEGDATESAAAPNPAASSATETVVVRERVRVRNGKKRLKKPGRAKKVVLAIIVAILIIALGAFAAVQLMAQSGKEAMTAAPAKSEDVSVTYKGEKYLFNDKAVSILFEGIDDEGGTTDCNDANYLATLDTETKKLTMTCIPRDSLCDVDIYQDGEYSFTSETNLALAYAQDADGKTCAENVVKSVSNILKGNKIKYYFALDVDGISELANKMGGITLEPIQSIPGTNIVKGKKITLKGDEAMRYVQYRDTSVDGSAQDRSKRQMQFLQAAFEKLRAMSATDLVSLVNTVSKYTTTNIGATELTYLATTFLGGGSYRIGINTLSGTVKSKVYEEDGIRHEYIELDKDSIKETVMKTFYKKIDE